MEISQFELVYKPQSPAGPADTVLQGYFLEITNLEDEQFEFAVSFTTSSISDPDRSLFNNATAFVDVPGANNSVRALSGSLTATTFVMNGRVAIPGKGTALVALLPSDPFPPSLVPPNAADFECRGFVQVTLPPLLEIVTGGSFPVLRQVAQSDEPVKVLVSAQNRAIYTDPTTGAPNGQTQGSLPLASGKAMNEIAPGQPFSFPIQRLNLTAASSLVENSPETFPDLLGSMLASAVESDMDLKKFNALLKKSGVGLAVEKRK